MAFGDPRGNLGVARTERCRQEMYFVAGDQFFGQLTGALTICLIVIGEQLHFHLFTADTDATRGVDPAQPHVICNLLLLAFIGQSPSQCQRCTDLDYIFC